MALNCCKSFSLSCFSAQYLIAFASLLSLAYLSCCFGCLVSLIGRLVILASLSWIVTKKVRKHLNKELITSYKRAVLVTGCDSGFGNAAALKLNENGFRVYATVLDPESVGAQKLVTGSRFADKTQVIRMDVINDEEVNGVYEQIKKDLEKNGEQLWSVVNNAGICLVSPLDWGTLDAYRSVFEVNTFGTVRVTRTFLPLLRKSKGRVVNVASVAGRITFTNLAVYSMSKHAVISFSDALRRETKKWGIKVSTIEPTTFKTPMSSQGYVNKQIDKQWTETPDHIKELYGQEFVEGLKDMSHIGVGQDIDCVINKIVDAIRNQEPQISYPVVSGSRHQRCAGCLLRVLPTEALDLVLHLKNRKKEKKLKTRRELRNEE